MKMNYIVKKINYGGILNFIFKTKMKFTYRCCNIVGELKYSLD